MQGILLPLAFAVAHKLQCSRDKETYANETENKKEQFRCDRKIICSQIVDDFSSRTLQAGMHFNPISPAYVTVVGVVS
jgi:hypothetical protein